MSVKPRIDERTLQVTCPKRVKNRSLGATYKMTLDEYAVRLEKQGGVCAICGGHETSRQQKRAVKFLSVDHDHKSGKIRGLLCTRCNTVLGMAKDSADTLLAAVRYLIRAR